MNTVARAIHRLLICNSSAFKINLLNQIKLSRMILYLNFKINASIYFSLWNKLGVLPFQAGSLDAAQGRSEGISLVWGVAAQSFWEEEQQTMRHNQTECFQREIYDRGSPCRKNKRVHRCYWKAGVASSSDSLCHSMIWRTQAGKSTLTVDSDCILNTFLTWRLFLIDQSALKFRLIL